MGSSPTVHPDYGSPERMFVKAARQSAREKETSGGEVALYRIFIDEVGNHDMKSYDKPTEQYLGVTGVIMRLDYEQGEFTASLNHIKNTCFGNINLILHRRDIVDRKPPLLAII